MSFPRSFDVWSSDSFSNTSLDQSYHLVTVQTGMLTFVHHQILFCFLVLIVMLCTVRTAHSSQRAMSSSLWVNLWSLLVNILILTYFCIPLSVPGEFYVWNATTGSIGLLVHTLFFSIRPCLYTFLAVVLWLSRYYATGILCGICRSPSSTRIAYCQR
jgi:energy-coupling factor transporter transmembrane protein EcfT